MLFFELLAQSLVQGCIYALIALGLTLVYGLLRILHVAHAALFTLGAYLGVLVYNASGSLLLAFAVAMALSGLGGVAMFRLAYQPLLARPPYVALIASIGLYIAAEEVFRIVFGASGLSFAQPPLQAQVAIGGLQFKEAELAVMVSSAIIIGLLGWLQTRTRIGIACQATVSDPQMAESFGIRLNTVRDLNFLVGSALAGATTTYAIVASNAGLSDAIDARVTDVFPASLACTWTCTGSGTCPVSGTGNIDALVNLPVGASVTFTAECDIDAGATGTISNTASIAAAAGSTDPVAGNNAATDLTSITGPQIFADGFEP